MLYERIEKLRDEYTDQYVAVDGSRPELARFDSAIGRVKTINLNGRALVQFDQHSDQAWYDIELDDLKVVDPPPPPEPKATKAKSKEAPKKKTPAEKKSTESSDPPEDPSKLSTLEIARLEKKNGKS